MSGGSWTFRGLNSTRGETTLLRPPWAGVSLGGWAAHPGHGSCVAWVCPSPVVVCSEALGRVSLKSPHNFSTELWITFCLCFPWGGLAQDPRSGQSPVSIPRV